ncbi:MAG: F0F1 ATP synthase subunit gamma, partial [Alphaproteobacteria bacterium]|nr:F0F1 ATP synthase subunit gamma [Alphaproteobacteria bacterium]
MTKRSQLKHYIRSLSEIGDIMTAMKNLSFIEINKLTKFMTNQEQVVRTLEDVGSDFLSFYPLLPSFSMERAPIYILIGSERGFCGSFNNIIMNQWLSEVKSEVKIIAIGRRLILKLSDDFQIIKEIEGPSVAEEVPEVISSLSSFLEENSISLSFGNFHIIYNEMINNQTITKSFSPFTKLGEQKK